LGIFIWYDYFIGDKLGFQLSFDLTTLAAILALVGYSNNDTIIVFDRVRETLQTRPNLNIVQAVNQSINDTLNRTIVTSVATFLVSASLFFFGGPVIKNFSFAFSVGILVGTYSSIFIASSLVVEFTHFRDRKEMALESSGSPRTKAKRVDA
jgi:preprotein translocase SecF subunit